MGLDLHGINFLRFALSRQRFGAVATMGRQGLNVAPDALQSILRSDKSYAGYCEELLRDHFGASTVESFDYSDFEGATHIVDLNEPVEIAEQYDTVIDAGTMEHIYNATEGLRTVSRICKPGGQILHMLPANNLCNHGFWQFSPELFFSLYTQRRGYAETQVFLADVGEETFWYEVRPPQSGSWDYAGSSRALYVLVRTKKVGPVSHENVQQSDYVQEWQRGPAATPSGIHNGSSIRGALRTAIAGTPLMSAARFLKRVIENPDRPLQMNSNLRPRPIAELITADSLLMQ